MRSSKNVILFISFGMKKNMFGSNLNRKKTEISKLKSNFFFNTFDISNIQLTQRFCKCMLFKKIFFMQKFLKIKL